MMVVGLIALGDRDKKAGQLQELPMAVAAHRVSLRDSLYQVRLKQRGCVVGSSSSFAIRNSQLTGRHDVMELCDDAAGEARASRSSEAKIPEAHSAQPIISSPSKSFSTASQVAKDTLRSRELRIATLTIPIRNLLAQRAATILIASNELGIIC